MKHRLRNCLSFIIALSMLLSMIPLYTAAVNDEFEGLETVEEIPFEFELEPGDLPLDELADAVLPAEDLPSYISASLAEEREHVNRLYLQEPDANTVMFQNRDGSKTIYVFSQPVKDTGVTLGTNALAVSGEKIVFSGNNIITNRIGLSATGKRIQDYKIGYSDIATLTSGVLTADGTDITEDVRNWALCEFGASDAEYNISSSASAAYAASVAVTETELTANAGESASANATTPGITITPIDPTPATGATVMSITYSDLAGKMCFKNAETNQYLALDPTTKNTLVTKSNIYGVYSYWIVQYEGTNQYTICSYFDRPNKYLGVYYEDLALVFGTLNELGEEAIFEISITSSADSTVEIILYFESSYAISSTGGLAQSDENDEFPASCSWIITNRSDYISVQNIYPQETARTVQAGEGFYEEYTTNPSNPTDSDIWLYYADIDQIVPYDDEAAETGEIVYCIPTPGVYTVYYKDELTGVRSANFTITAVTNVTAITPSSTTRVEQKSVPFAPIYVTTPLNYVVYDINLYYADDIEVSKNTDGLYYIDTPGTYTVYYKDTIAGVRSEDFQLIIVDQVSSIQDNYTYTIQPKTDSSKYLTMHANTKTVDGATIYNADSNDITVESLTLSDTVAYEKWDDISRTFVFEWNENAGYTISATLATKQYLTVPSSSDYVYTGTNTSYKIGGISSAVYKQIESNYNPNYYYTELEDQNNALHYYFNFDENSYVINTNDHEESNTRFSLHPVSVTNNNNTETYYLIICGYSGSNVQVLTYGTSGLTVSTLNSIDDTVLWKINRVGVNAPLIKQTTNYWCGYTTSLQVLYGKEYNVLGDTIHEKVKRIAHVDFQSPYSMPSGWVANEEFNAAFAEYTPSYDVYNHDNQWETRNPETLIVDSLNDGWAPFFITATGGAPYKESSGNGHFICIVGFDTINDYVILANCHYNDNIFGIYAVKTSNFYDALDRLFFHSPD